MGVRVSGSESERSREWEIAGVGVRVCERRSSLQFVQTFWIVQALQCQGKVTHKTSVNCE